MEYFTTKTIKEINKLLPAIDLFYGLDTISRAETTPRTNLITTTQLTNLYKILINQSNHHRSL